MERPPQFIIVSRDFPQELEENHCKFH